MDARQQARQAGGVRITMAGEQSPRVDVAALERALRLVQYWARIAAWMPGIAPERAMPPFADETFQAWFRHHTPRHPQGRRGR